MEEFEQAFDEWMEMLGHVCLDEDGKRPWHRRFHVRQVGDRQVALWLGEYHIAGLPLSRSRLAQYYGFQRDSTLRAIFGGGSWTGLQRFAAQGGASFEVGPLHPSDHPRPCSSAGFIGIAYLPDGYPNPKSIWPGWKHLAHAISDWQDLLPIYDYALALDDEALVGLIEEDDTSPMMGIMKALGQEAGVRL